MNERTELASGCEVLTARYEELRQEVTLRVVHRGFGLVLFLREGMVSWMKAYSEAVSEPLSRSDPSTLPPLSWDTRAEATSILATMALEGYREVAQ